MVRPLTTQDDAGTCRQTRQGTAPGRVGDVIGWGVPLTDPFDDGRGHEPDGNGDREPLEAAVRTHPGMESCVGCEGAREHGGTEPGETDTPEGLTGHYPHGRLLVAIADQRTTPQASGTAATSISRVAAFSRCSAVHDSGKGSAGEMALPAASRASWAST